MQVKLRPLIKGTLSFAVPSLRTFHKAAPSSSVSADFCYSMFLRHLSYVAPLTGAVPAVVAELGPGSSIGMGLAALIAGATTYHALDIADHTDRARNLAIFDRLVALYRMRRPVPSDGVSRDIFPPPAAWEFPAMLGSEPFLEEERLAAIRQDVAEGTGRFIHMQVPWTDGPGLAAGSIDWLISQSVLCYIDDMEATARQFARWLAPGGLMTHEIDYASSLTRGWDGHRALRPWTLRLIRGRRPHLLNQMAHSGYLRLFADHGFTIVNEVREVRVPAVGRSRYVASRRTMSDIDVETAEGFIVCRLAPNELAGRVSAKDDGGVVV